MGENAKNGAFRKRVAGWRSVKRAVVPALLLLVIPGTASAISYPAAIEEPTLEAKLPTTVQVFCTGNTSLSFAMIDDKQIFLSATVCSLLLDMRPGDHDQNGYTWAMAARVLYHEWWHVAARQTDERLTEVGAYTIYRYALRRFWNLSARQAQDLYWETTRWSPYQPLPYVPTAVDPLLPTR